MQTQNQIESFLFQGKFDEARECLHNGENFNEQYLKNNFSQIAAKIIEAKEIDFIEKLIKAGFIETDIYELDSFDKSIFNSLTRLKDSCYTNSSTRTTKSWYFKFYGRKEKSFIRFKRAFGCRNFNFRRI